MEEYNLLWVEVSENTFELQGVDGSKSDYYIAIKLHYPLDIILRFPAFSSGYFYAPIMFMNGCIHDLSPHRFRYNFEKSAFINAITHFLDNIEIEYRFIDMSRDCGTQHFLYPILEYGNNGRYFICAYGDEDKECIPKGHYTINLIGKYTEKFKVGCNSFNDYFIAYVPPKSFSRFYYKLDHVLSHIEEFDKLNSNILHDIIQTLIEQKRGYFERTLTQLRKLKTSLKRNSSLENKIAIATDLLLIIVNNKLKNKSNYG